jgi:hypothetical protein
MAAATSVSRYTAVLGPCKVEFINCTMAATGDTIVSRLQSPSWAMAMTNADGGGAATSISGRTITVTDAGISASTVNLIVVGF